MDPIGRPARSAEIVFRAEMENVHVDLATKSTADLKLRLLVAASYLFGADPQQPQREAGTSWCSHKWCLYLSDDCGKRQLTPSIAIDQTLLTRGLFS